VRGFCLLLRAPVSECAVADMGSLVTVSVLGGAALSSARSRSACVQHAGSRPPTGAADGALSAMEPCTRPQAQCRRDPPGRGASYQRGLREPSRPARAAAAVVWRRGREAPRGEPGCGRASAVCPRRARSRIAQWVYEQSSTWPAWGPRRGPRREALYLPLVPRAARWGCWGAAPHQPRRVLPQSGRRG